MSTASEQIATRNIGEDELAAIRLELPEIDLLADPEEQLKVTGLWASFLKESTYSSISEAPAFPGVPGYDLAGHTRQVVLNSLALAGSMVDFWKIDYDREALIAAGLTHDASKLVEFEGPEGSYTETGNALLHAQLAGVRCLEFGLSPKVAYLVTYHPFTPPHIHLTPRYLEFVILTWADIAAADTVFFHEEKATHLQIEKRFFSLD